MKNTKVLMSLVAASIAAMAAAPELLKEKVATENVENDIIKLKNEESAISPEVKAEIQNQVNALLAKKTPIMKMSESISILVDNYGNDDGSIKENIYKELNLGAGTIIDSTSVARGSLTIVPLTGTQNQNFCHGACHGACHEACHGSRGWR